MHAETTKYPQQVQDLLAPIVNLQFDFAPQNPEAKSVLKSISPEELFHSPITNQKLARCCHSGLWLLNGFLHESHEISQTIKAPEGSYWHAIMHRAEGDFWNSKYWYRQVREHAVLDQLRPYGVTGEGLVDLCEQSTHAANTRERTTELVKTEWSLLFEFCWNGATAS